MAAILLYSMKSALVLALLYVPYMLMLRRESFFRFNRLVLLGILLLSLILPLCNVSGLSLDRQPVVQAAQRQMLELGMPVHYLPELLITPEEVAPQPTSSINLFMLVSLIYIIGIVVVLLVRGLQIYRLQSGLQRGNLWSQQEDGVTIYCHADSGVPPFSWMKSIVLNEADYEEAGREIVLHETGHIRNRHSWDVLLLTLVEMLQWWNPLVYMLGISLRDVHEYEADNYVLSSGVSPSEYQLLLIKKAVGSGSYAFANNFNHSLTKKRITMMKKSKSNPWMRSKALYVIPVAALALSAFATPKFVAPIEGAVSKLEGKVTENSPNLQTSEEKRKVVELKEAPRIVVDGKEMPPQEALKAVQGKEIQNNLATLPDGSTALSIKTRPKDAQPLIVLNDKIFEIPKNAMKDIIEEEQFAKLLNINIEDIKSITVLQKDAATAIWGDKGSDGAIVIKTKDANDATQTSDPAVDVQKPDSVYNVVAHNAKYPGGEGEFFAFISKNIRYPKLCQEFGVQGRVTLQFVVEKDGSITEISKLRGPGHQLTQVEVTSYKEDHPDSTEQLEVGQDLGDLLIEESIRILKLMPKWEPARNEKDEVVRSRFIVPFLYRLN